MPLLSKIATASGQTPRFVRPAAVIFGILGVVLGLALAGSQFIQVINPYNEAAEQVSNLLLSQPDLETRLDYRGLIRGRLSSSLDPQFANAINDVAASAENQLVDTLTPTGVRAANVRTFTSLMNNAAVELQALDARLAQENLAANLKPLFFQTRQQPSVADANRLNLIYDRSPKVIEDLTDIRRRLLSISNTIRSIQDNPEVLAVAEALMPDGSVSLLEGSDARVYSTSYTAWKSLPDASESLEIQFAGTISTLNDIYSAVNAARQLDRRWGYSTWEPAALWINHNGVLLFVITLLFLLAAGVLALTYGLIQIDLPLPLKRALGTAAAARITQPLAALRGGAGEPLGSQAAAATAGTARRRLISTDGEAAAPRLLVMWPNGERETLPLSADKAFRIGTDPRNPVFIDNREAGYIEIWIRSARTGFFIEVMFCESEVMVNRRPITAAKSLQNGDMIQVLDLTLFYFDT